MNLHEETCQLCAVPLFRRIDASKLKLLAFTSERQEYAPGEIICSQGDEGESAFVILRGRAEVLVAAGPEESLTKVSELGPNSVVGEMATLCDRPRSATVRALTPVDALRIPRDSLRSLLHSNPLAMIEIIRLLSDRLAATTEELGKLRNICANA